MGELGHYFAYAFRRLRRTPFSTSMAVLTLSLGLFCFICLYSVVTFLRTAENHFSNADRTFAVSTRTQSLINNSTLGALPYTNRHVAAYLRTDFPQIENVVRARVLNDNMPVWAEGNTARLFTVAVDDEFFEIFDPAFVAGDRTAALTQPRSAVVTVEGARRLFGTSQALGSSITFGGTVDATVAGVVSAIPEPSHMAKSASTMLPFDLLVSYDVHEALLRAEGESDGSQSIENWLETSVTTYVMLPEDGSLSAQELNAQLADFVDRHAPPGQTEVSEIALELVPVADLLGTTVSGAVFLQESGVSVATVLVLLGALILAVACLNYTNLETALANESQHEIGVRKSIGAAPRQVMLQSLVDTALKTGLALCFALALTPFAFPILDQIFGINLRAVSPFSERVFWVILAGLMLVVTVSAGAYPAFIVARTSPLAAFRHDGPLPRRRALAAGLVGVQFAVATFLLAAVLIVYLQNSQLLRTGLGLSSEQLLVIENDADSTGLEQATLLQELLQLSGVLDATGLSLPPWGAFWTVSLSRSPDAAETPVSAVAYIVDAGFFETFGMTLVAGRFLSPQRADDSLLFDPNRPERPRNIVADRTYTEGLGFAAPEEAVDEIVYIPSTLTAGFGIEVALPHRIVGIVDTKPLIMTSHGLRGGIYSFGRPLTFQVVKLRADGISETLDRIDALWRRLVPSIEISRRFVDDYFNESYESFTRIGKVFTALTVFALTISTVGLFAMAMFVARTRTKEVAIRKVLGVTRGRACAMLLFGFLTPALVGGIIALPLAYFAVASYLEVFINPIELTFYPFIASLVLAALISCITVAAFVWRTASASPATVLHRV